MKDRLESKINKEEFGDGESRNFENLQKGIKFYNDGNRVEALKEFFSVYKLINDDEAKFDVLEKTELFYYLGLCYTKLGQYEEALTFLEQVVTTSTDILRIYQCRITLAYIYVLTKRVKMAEFELNRLRSAGLESPLLYNTLAYAAWLQKKHKTAIELYEKSLEIDTNNATAMNSMGYILSDTGIDIMKGLRLCRKAVDIRPHNAAYLDSLGWAYYKSGDVKEGRTWLRRALDLAPGEAEIQKHFRIITGEQL